MRQGNYNKGKQFTVITMAIIMLLALLIAAMPTGIEAKAASSKDSVTMYRIYNPNSGEHFYTADTNEKDNIITAGWSYEGMGWIAPVSSDTPVYRLYNSNVGEHHYTMDLGERDYLVSVGWSDEGIGWYSDDAMTVPLYRQYNSGAMTGTHNYTTSPEENNYLVSIGWNEEGIGWYGTVVYQGEYKEYLSTQNILYGQKVDRIWNTEDMYYPTHCAYSEGTLGYVVEDVNNDGIEELIQLDINVDGVVTISEKINNNGTVTDVGVKKQIKITNEFDKVGFYTFKSGDDTYLLVTYGCVEGVFANGEKIGLFCYKLENDKIITIIDKTDSFSTGSIEEVDYSWLNILNKVFALQGKAIDINQCDEILYANDFNLEPYMELSSFASLKMNKTYRELYNYVEKLSNEWGYDRSNPYAYDGAYHEAVISTQYITP